jgi:hypothetical protein
MPVCPSCRSNLRAWGVRSSASGSSRSGAASRATVDALKSPNSIHEAPLKFRIRDSGTRPEMSVRACTVIRTNAKHEPCFPPPRHNFDQDRFVSLSRMPASTKQQKQAWVHCRSLRVSQTASFARAHSPTDDAIRLRNKNLTLQLTSL